MIFGTLDFKFVFQVFRKFGRKNFLKEKFFCGRYSQFEKKIENFFQFLKSASIFCNQSLKLQKKIPTKSVFFNLKIEYFFDQNLQ